MNRITNACFQYVLGTAAGLAAVLAMLVLACAFLTVNGCSADSHSRRIDSQPVPRFPIPLPEFAQPSPEPLMAGIVRVMGCDGGMGSGSIIRRENGMTYVLTAAHVVEGGDTLCFIEGLPGTVTAISGSWDVALVQTPLLGELPILQLDLGLGYMGQPVHAAGWGGYAHTQWAIRTEGTIAGHIAGKILYDGGVTPGMSGGPLLTSDNKIIGVCSDVIPSWNAPNPSLSRFVPAWAAQRFLDQISQKGN